ncbi:MAG TPA: protein arginine kinase [Candidatus Omnitrophota bacterium]|nr:protein arginine kinase [Candidatus Omnitrophota bacterium]
MSVADDLMKSSCEWLRGKGEACEIVMSSRTRLARNIQGFPFPHRISKTDAEEVITIAESALKQSPCFKGSFFLRQRELTLLDRQFLLERHLISREHAGARGPVAACVTRNEIAGVMILEEDHLRIQVIESGLNLTEAWRVIDGIDSSLESVLSYAFHPSLGYLTACPTNVGTGLRASCMMHLPALVMTKQAAKILQAISKLNLAARGMYGEGTEATGNLFQISNQMTLGQSEAEILDSLERVIRQIIEHEKEARQVLVTKRKDKLEDQIWRALGALKTARLISSKETMSLLSLVRLGMDLGLIAQLERTKLNELFMKIQPSHLQKVTGKSLSSSERDFERAKLLRQELNSVSFS